MSAQCHYNSTSQYISHRYLGDCVSSLKADMNSTISYPIPSAACLSDPAFAQVLALTEDYTIVSTSVTCSQTDGDSLCGDSPVDPPVLGSQQLHCEGHQRHSKPRQEIQFTFLGPGR